MMAETVVEITGYAMGGLIAAFMLACIITCVTDWLRR